MYLILNSVCKDTKKRGDKQIFFAFFCLFIIYYGFYPLSLCFESNSRANIM